jgi:hypothetical protein
MSITIDCANDNDIAGMVELSKRKRLSYEQNNPIFWKKAENAESLQYKYFTDLLQKNDVKILVSRNETGINGFIIAQIKTVPPVYDIGSLNCYVDDFVVDHPGEWQTIGKRLLIEMIALMKNEGVVQIVIVCGNHDKVKKGFLEKSEFSIVTNWYAMSIAQNSNCDRDFDET